MTTTTTTVESYPYLAGAEIDSVYPIDMYTALLNGGMFLLLEGFTHGYQETEDAVNRLHQLLHFELIGRVN